MNNNNADFAQPQRLINVFMVNSSTTPATINGSEFALRYAAKILLHCSVASVYPADPVYTNLRIVDAATQSINYFDHTFEIMPSGFFSFQDTPPIELDKNIKYVLQLYRSVVAGGGLRQAQINYCQLIYI